MVDIDRNTILELLPHYVAMLAVVFLVLTALDVWVGGVSFWIELVIIVVVVALYRPVVMRLGVAPSSWEE